MCVIYFAFDHHIDLPLILIANRDEFYERPSRPASYWEDFPHIYAGRDLVQGGTWLGVTNGGRLAAVTNYRDPSAPPGRRSRGDLVADFLKGREKPEDYLEAVKCTADEYSGFNLLVGEIDKDKRELYYYSNRGTGIKRLSAGVYGLSNHLLDTSWPKVADGKKRFADLIQGESIDDTSLFGLLSDESLAADEDLPSTGIPYEREKALSAIFIRTPEYGTRCSTVMRFDNKMRWSFEERVFV